MNKRSSAIALGLAIVAVLVLAVTVVVGPDAWPHVLGVPAVFDAATRIW